MQKDDFLDKDSFYSEGGFQVTNRSKNFLATAATWSKFLAIIGFIGTALMVLVGIIAVVAGSAFGNLSQNPVFGAIGSIGIAFIYIILALVYFFPSLFLLNFSSKIKRAIRSSDNLELEEAFKNLKSLFMFYGIMTILFIVLYFFIIIFAMVAGASI